MNRYFSKTNVVIMVLITCVLWGCKKKEDEKMGTQTEVNEDEQVYIIEAKITEKIDMPDPEFADFLTFRCVVTDSLGTPIPKGENVVFIIPKDNVTKQNLTKTEIKTKHFNLGGVYRLAITFAMPKGWDALKEVFSDERCFMMACLRIEDVNMP